MKTDAAYVAVAPHSPYMALQRDEAHPGFWAAYEGRRRELEEFDPDLIVLFGTDHYKSFYLSAMPQFAVALNATGYAELGGWEGALDVPEDIASALAEFLLEYGFDIATARDLKVDHGFTGMLHEMIGDLDAKPVIPIFINSGFEPRAPLRRSRELGEAVGRFFIGQGKRVAFLGSGGLSHDNDFVLPQYRTVRDEEMRRFIVHGDPVTRDQQFKLAEHFLRSSTEGLLNGEIPVQGLRPEWDRKFLGAFASGDMRVFDTWDDATVVNEGGAGAGEGVLSFSVQ